MAQKIAAARKIKSPQETTSLGQIATVMAKLRISASNLIDPVYDDCSMKKQPISTAVVLEFRELLK